MKLIKYKGPQYLPNKYPKNAVSTTIPEKIPKKYLNPDSIDLNDLLIVKTEFLDPFLWKFKSKECKCENPNDDILINPSWHILVI